MRVAPHAIYAENPEDLTNRVILDSIATHGHPRAIIGALTYARVIAHAFHSKTTINYGDLLSVAEQSLVHPSRFMEVMPSTWISPDDTEGFRDLWSSTNNEMRQLLEIVDRSLRRGSMSSPDETLMELGCCDEKVNGAGTVSAAGAIYIASRFAARPLAGLVSAAFLRKADTDTLASMAGALLGAIHGTDWLGKLAHNVQDSEYLSELATQLVDRAHQDPVEVHASPKKAKAVFFRQLSSAAVGSVGELPDGRRYVLEEISWSGKEHRRAHLALSDGQTVIVTTRSTEIPQDISSLKEQPSISPQAPLEATTQSARLIEIALVTHDLNRCKDFYQRLLGQDIAEKDGMIEVVPGLRMRCARTIDDRDGSATVTIAVRDIDRVLKKSGIELKISRGEHYAIDPDGRIVRIVSSPRESKSP